MSAPGGRRARPAVPPAGGAPPPIPAATTLAATQLARRTRTATSCRARRSPTPGRGSSEGLLACTAVRGSPGGWQRAGAGGPPLEKVGCCRHLTAATTPTLPLLPLLLPSPSICSFLHSTVLPPGCLAGRSIRRSIVHACFAVLYCACCAWYDRWLQAYLCISRVPAAACQPRRHACPSAGCTGSLHGCWRLRCQRRRATWQGLWTQAGGAPGLHIKPKQCQ